MTAKERPRNAETRASHFRTCRRGMSSSSSSGKIHPNFEKEDEMRLELWDLQASACLSPCAYINTREKRTSLPLPRANKLVWGAWFDFIHFFCVLYGCFCYNSNWNLDVNIGKITWCPLYNSFDVLLFGGLYTASPDIDLTRFTAFKRVPAT